MMSPTLGASLFRSMSLPWVLLGSHSVADPNFHRWAVIGATGKPSSARSIAGWRISRRENYRGKKNHNSNILLGHRLTFPEPNFSMVSTQPAAAPGTVTLSACLAGMGLVGVYCLDCTRSRVKLDEQRPLDKKQTKPLLTIPSKSG